MDQYRKVKKGELLIKMSDLLEWFALSNCKWNLRSVG